MKQILISAHYKFYRLLLVSFFIGITACFSSDNRERDLGESERIKEKVRENVQDQVNLIPIPDSIKHEKRIKRIESFVSKIKEKSMIKKKIYDHDELEFVVKLIYLQCEAKDENFIKADLLGTSREINQYLIESRIIHDDPINISFFSQEDQIKSVTMEYCDEENWPSNSSEKWEPPIATWQHNPGETQKIKEAQQHKIELKQEEGVDHKKNKELSGDVNAQGPGGFGGARIGFTAGSEKASHREEDKRLEHHYEQSEKREIPSKSSARRELSFYKKTLNIDYKRITIISGQVSLLISEGLARKSAKIYHISEIFSNPLLQLSSGATIEVIEENKVKKVKIVLSKSREDYRYFKSVKTLYYDYFGDHLESNVFDEDYVSLNSLQPLAVDDKEQGVKIIETD